MSSLTKSYLRFHYDLRLAGPGPDCEPEPETAEDPLSSPAATPRFLVALKVGLVGNIEILRGRRTPQDSFHISHRLIAVVVIHHKPHCLPFADLTKAFRPYGAIPRPLPQLLESMHCLVSVQRLSTSQSDDKLCKRCCKSAKTLRHLGSITAQVDMEEVAMWRMQTEVLEQIILRR